jgi:hypothetical protein
VTGPVLVSVKLTFSGAKPPGVEAVKLATIWSITM